MRFIWQPYMDGFSVLLTPSYLILQIKCPLINFLIRDVLLLDPAQYKRWVRHDSVAYFWNPKPTPSPQTSIHLPAPEEFKEKYEILSQH